MGKSVLRQAIEDAERIAPLPRCKHGSALRDGGGEALVPTCGCRAGATDGAEFAMRAKRGDFDGDIVFVSPRS